MERLVYGLVQRIVMHPGNLKTRGDFWESMFRSLADDGVKVSYMVPVNAIFSEIRSRYLNSPETAKESLMTSNLDFRRAWEIVDNIGYSSIIEKFRRGVWE